MQQASTTWPTLPPNPLTIPQRAASSDPTAPNTLVERGARALFEGSGYRALSAIECTADGGVLSLDGQVHSYYHKQVAQEIASRVAGVRRVKNDIRVLD